MMGFARRNKANKWVLTFKSLNLRKEVCGKNIQRAEFAKDLDIHFMHVFI
jgi:hypothetical protein